MATDAYYRYAFSATIGLEGSIERAILECTTGSLIYEIKADELVKAGFLSQPIVEVYEIPHVYNDERGWSKLESMFICNNLYRNTVISQLAERYSSQGTVLVSVNKIIHGNNLQKLIPGSIFIHGKSEDRNEVIEKFKNKGLRISDGKTHGTIVDFIDRSVPMLRKHSKERIKTYEREGFTVNLHKELVY